jgi:hypothetical protein
MDSKLNRIKSLMGFLKTFNIIPKDEYVNAKLIVINSNILNRIIYDIYKNHGKKSASSMAKFINCKYDTDLDVDDINKVWNNKNFMYFMDSTYVKQESILKDVKMIQGGKHVACKMYGGDKEVHIEPLDEIDYTDNILNNFWKALNDEKFMEKPEVKQAVEHTPFLKAIYKKDYDEMASQLTKWIIDLHPERVIEFMLFPLYYIENMEGTGPMNSLLIDLVGMWINMVDIIVKIVVPIALTSIQASLTASATIPGVGTATAPIATALELAEEPIQFFLMGLPSFIKVIFTIQRKQFKQALNDMTNIFPIIGVMMVSAVNFLSTANKLLLLTSQNLENISSNLERWSDLIPDQANRIKNLDFGAIYNNFVKTNKGKSGLLDLVVNKLNIDETFEKYNKERAKVMDTYNKGISGIDSITKSPIMEMGNNINKLQKKLKKNLI